MKRILLILTILFSISVSAQMEKVIDNRPNPPKLVNDYTNTLTPFQKEALETKLYQYDDTTSNQIAVVIVESTDRYSIEDAATTLGRKWGVGNKEFNNGIVILVAKGDRKVTIQVGYGLEGVITDLTARSIIDNEVTPNFKQGNYYRGLDEAVDNIIKAAEGRYQAPANYKSKKSKGISIGTVVLILLILFIIFAGAGPGGGTYVSRGGFGGWSGGSGKGWSGGGSSSGGGFGGFGGGSFGGGGASGSW